MAARYLWDQLLQYALSDACSGNLKERHRQLRLQIEAGQLPGPCPDYTSFWRRCSRVKHKSHAPFPKTTAERSGKLIIEAASSAEGTQTLALPVARETATKSLLDEAETSLLAVVPPLIEYCPELLPAQITVELQHLLKRIGTARRAPRLTPQENDARGEELRDEQLDYRERLAKKVFAFSEQYRPLLTESIEHGLVPPRCGEDPLLAPDKRAATVTVPGGAFSTAPAGHWGQRIVTEIQPAQGAKITQLTPDDTRLRAMFKSAVVQPILNGLLNPKQLLAALGRFARNEPTAQDQLYLGNPDPRFIQKYYQANVRTIEYWVNRCATAIAAAEKAGTPPPSLTDLLEHRQAKGARKRTKRTPEVEALVRLHYTTQGCEHTLFSAAAVARYLHDTGQAHISERTAQAIINETLPDLQRGIMRGGVAASDVLFRSRLHQISTRPNRCWILDHSFSQSEFLDPDHPEYSDQVTPNEELEWPFPYAVEHRNHTGTWKYARKKGVYVSLMMDACTRRTLAIRLWDRVPTTEMTLSLVYDAVAEFGAPDFLYTDNGADFRSQLFRERVVAAGIQQVFSLPYSPEGRGAIERLFRSLKEMVMPLIPGYLGARGTTYEAPVQDLLTLPELEERVWTILDHYLNYREHSTTHRKPATHYDEMIGGRAFRGTEPRALIALLPSVVRLRETWGVNFGGLPYWSPKLVLVPIGAEVVVYHHPVRWQTVHLAVVASDGGTEFLGVAEYYDANNPPPDIGERQKLEGLLRARLAPEDIPRLTKAAERVRSEAATVAAEAGSAEFVASLMPASEGRKQLVSAIRLLSPAMDRADSSEDDIRDANSLGTVAGAVSVPNSGNPSALPTLPKPQNRPSPSRVLVDPLAP